MTIVSSCSIISDDLSCKFSEIDCYRFNYSSIENFRDSVTDHASKWDLKDPADALSNLTINKELSIKSSNEAEELILTNPEDIYVLAKYINENQKPREWLLLAEQAFLRSWNNLNR
ncbi:MAG: hypothetical protein HOH08_06735 [Gammaproteobacteria bacterium]|jgi:hypothetical protein|nr:hypothetical protein [Gammaproteobacteria bacterium]